MSKRQDIELLRIVSTFAIVWFHSGISLGHEVSLSGLIVFLILSMYLSGIHDFSGEFRIQQKFSHLIIPWIIWFAIYGAKNMLFNKPLIPYQHVEGLGILSGASIHLWYMPFIFISLIAFDYIRSLFSKISIAYASAAFSILILLTTPIWRPASIQAGYPIMQYAHALPGVLLGVFFSNFYALQKTSRQLLLVSIIAAAILAIPYKNVGIPYLIGISAGCILILNSANSASNTNINFVSNLTFGIYFIHVLVMMTLNKIIPNMEIYLPISAFFASALCILFFKNIFPKFSKYMT